MAKYKRSMSTGSEAQAR
jgi:hypothetical protein